MRTIGNYWPYATTVWDYINRAMPFDSPGSLSPNEVYALTAYLLSENQIIAALAGRYDQLDALWQHAEEDLKRFRLHNVVTTAPFKSIPLFEDRGCGDPHEYHVLGFLRCGKSWRICYGVSRDAPDGGEDGPHWTPISDCSVDLRIEVIPVFEELRKTVVETAEQSVPKLDAALTKAQATGGATPLSAARSSWKRVSR